MRRWAFAWVRAEESLDRLRQSVRCPGWERPPAPRVQLGQAANHARQNRRAERPCDTSHSTLLDPAVRQYDSICYLEPTGYLTSRNIASPDDDALQIVLPDQKQDPGEMKVIQGLEDAENSLSAPYLTGDDQTDILEQRWSRVTDDAECADEVVEALVDVDETERQQHSRVSEVEAGTKVAGSRGRLRGLAPRVRDHTHGTRRHA